MSRKPRQLGFTLPELAVTVGVMALLVGVGIPAIRVIMDSFESGGPAKAMISSALASARAVAAKEGRYAGVRFQKAYNPDASDPLNPLSAPQYMVLIIHDPEREPSGTGLANGFRAIEGCKPMKLPDSIGVMDLTLVSRSVSGSRVTITAEEPIDSDVEIDALEELRDTTTFSIIFSPSGRLVVHEVRVRNRNGIPDTAARSGDTSGDDVFNKAAEVGAGGAMFYQDDYPALGLGPEYSRRRFVIYDRAEFRRAFSAGRGWSDCLRALAGDAIYINPHTGTIIPKD